MTLRRSLLATALGLSLPLTLAAAPLPGLKYEDYRTGYEALLANGDVEDAYQLAFDISRRYPKDQDWQRRLARVAVWTERPTEAYAAWKGLFRAGVRDREVLGEVQRLATHFNDAPVLIELWPAQEIDAEEAPQLAALYERAYRPVDGARFFEQAYQKQRRPWLGAQAAQLYARAGKDDDAIRLYRALLADTPANGGWLMAAARLEIRRDRRRAALELLKRHQAHMPDDAFEYWQMLGDLAWLYQDDTTAAAAYRRAAITPGAGDVERDRLTYLLLQEDPMQAADLCLRYHSEGGGAAWLLRALEIQVAHNAWPEARQALSRPHPQEQHALQQNPRFLQLRAHVKQHFGDNTAAVIDMRHALALAPDDDHVQVSALWLFIATGERAALEAMLNGAEAEAADPRFRQALAAASHTLGRHHEALAYYRLQLEQTPDDPILLLNYADLLQNTGQAGMAARLRQQAWRLTQHMADHSGDERYLARQRSQLAEQPGDAAALRVRRLRAQSRDFSATRVRQLDELLLAWALENGQQESVEAWVRRNHGHERPAPLWVQLRLALETRDHDALQHLLTARGDHLPASSAHEAALLEGNWPLAWSYAFEGAQRHPDDDELHQRLVETNDAHGDYVEAGWQQADYSDLDSRRYRLRADTALSARWRLALEGYNAEQTLRNATLLRRIPAEDKGVALEVQWSAPRQHWQLSLDSRHELTGYTGWRLAHRREWDHRLQLDLQLASRQPSEHSTALQIAGHADRAGATLNWAATRRIYLSAQLASERYHTQHGAYLGSGSQGIWEAGYRIRGEYPDWNMRAYGAHYRYRADGTPDAAALQVFTAQTLTDTPASQWAGLFVPKDNDYYALCGGAGQYLRERYSRALRPLADACAVHSREGGEGYSLLAGLSGSLDGEDQLTLVWEHSHASRQAGGRDLRIITLTYRRYF